MSEYKERVCQKCGRIFSAHYLGPFRMICSACFYEREDAVPNKGGEIMTEPTSPTPLEKEWATLRDEFAGKHDALDDEYRAKLEALREKHHPKQDAEEVKP